MEHVPSEMELKDTKLTLLSRRKGIDIQFCGPHCVTHLRESSTVLYLYHEWEVYIYSCNSRKFILAILLLSYAFLDQKITTKISA